TPDPCPCCSLLESDCHSVCNLAVYSEHNIRSALSDQRSRKWSKVGLVFTNEHTLLTRIGNWNRYTSDSGCYSSEASVKPETSSIDDQEQTFCRRSKRYRKWRTSLSVALECILDSHQSRIVALELPSRDSIANCIGREKARLDHFNIDVADQDL